MKHCNIGRTEAHADNKGFNEIYFLGLTSVIKLLCFYVTFVVYESVVLLIPPKINFINPRTVMGNANCSPTGCAIMQILLKPKVIICQT